MPARARSSQISYGILRPFLTQFAAIDRLVMRSRGACEHWVDGFAVHALSAGEQRELTRAIYDRNPTGRRELFDWERAWFEQRLPPAPARILIGGAGSGREVRWLQAAGYRVDAFDPSATAVRALSRVMSSNGSAVLGGYEDLLAPQHALARLVENRYEAVIAGWTSLSHVLEADRRQALFELCHHLCPQGPILASFLVAQAPLRRGRAHGHGTRVGRAIGALRGVDDRAEAAQIHFLSHGGFAHWFSIAELESLGAAIGRTLSFEPSPYPHATWLPPHPTQTPIASQTPIGID